jgi:two-component system, sensor histidine kinase YesM
VKAIHFHLSLHSVQTKIVLLLLSIFAFFASFLIIENLYAIMVVRQQVSQSDRNTITLHMSRVDALFTNAERFLIERFSSDADIQTIEYGKSNNDLQMAKLSISNKFSEATMVYDNIDAFFLYSPISNCYIEGNSQVDEYDQLIQIRRFISAYFNNKTSSVNLTNWFPEKINNKYYLLRVIEFDSTYVGAWVSTDRLLSPLKAAGLGRMNDVLFASDNGQALSSVGKAFTEPFDLSGGRKNYYNSLDGQRYMVVSAPSSKGTFSLLALIGEKGVIEGLGVLQIVISLISLGVVILFPLFLIILHRMIVFPLNRVVKAMELIKEGNLDVHIDDRKTSDEFKIMNETFNSMTSEIKQLKIDIYEEKLIKQKAELQYFQLQIKPHFLMNCLNMISNLVQVKEYTLVQNMINYVGEYFQYGLKSNLSVASIKNELRHVENYLKIQQFRFPGKLNISIDVDDILKSALIPPLLIQTFLENSVKYALGMDEPTAISIEIHVNHSNEQLMEIDICDTGPGFPEQILMFLETGQHIIDAACDHIGIYNIQQRLWLIYGESASMTFSNEEPHGAHIHVVIPLGKKGDIGGVLK